MPAFRPDQRVLVSPAHMAGHGSPTHALGPLIHLFEWSTSHDPETGHVTLSSPEGHFTVDFNPSDPQGRWWTVARHGEDSWKAAFSRETPGEMVGAVTQSLPGLAGDDRYIAPLPDTDPLEAAVQSGWQRHTLDDTTLCVAPDGHCWVAHQPADETPWRIENRAYDGINGAWTAIFTTHTPAPLVARFVTYLATNAPAERRYADIPAVCRDHAHITPLGRRPRVVEELSHVTARRASQSAAPAPAPAAPPRPAPRR